MPPEPRPPFLGTHWPPAPYAQRQRVVRAFDGKHPGSLVPRLGGASGVANGLIPLVSPLVCAEPILTPDDGPPRRSAAASPRQPGLNTCSHGGSIGTPPPRGRCPPWQRSQEVAASQAPAPSTWSSPPPVGITSGP